MFVKTQDLYQMLGRLSRIMPKQTPLLAELCYRLWADAGTLYGYAANTGDGISLQLGIPCDGEFQDVVVADTLGKVLQYLKCETVELSLTEDGSQVVCKSENSTSRHMISTNYMPEISIDDAESVGVITAREFAMIASGVVQLTNKNSAESILRAVCIRGGYVSATDKFSAARVFCPELDKHLVAFPTGYALAEFARFEVDADVSASDSGMLFVGDKVEMRMLQVDIPRAMDISVLFTQDAPKNVSGIDAAEFVSILNAASVFTEHAIYLDVTPDELVVRAREYHATMPCVANTSDVLMFDVNRMLQASRSFFKTVEFSFHSAQKPLLFKGKCEYAMMGMCDK